MSKFPLLSFNDAFVHHALNILDAPVKAVLSSDQAPIDDTILINCESRVLQVAVPGSKNHTSHVAR